MAAFGHPTDKPTWVYSNWRFVSEVDTHALPKKNQVRCPDKQMIVRSKGAGGKVKWTGGRDMKDSQHYPRQFGVALMKVHQAHKTDLDAA
eukprot:4006494-Alexandrium_andersonii.AAC.1